MFPCFSQRMFPHSSKMKFAYFHCVPNIFRSLNDFTTEDIERLNNVSFSDPEYTNKVPSLLHFSFIPNFSQFSANPTSPGVAAGQLGLFLRLHPAVLCSECTHWAGTRHLFISKILNLIWKFFFYQYADRPFKILGFPCNQFLRQVL